MLPFGSIFVFRDVNAYRRAPCHTHFTRLSAATVFVISQYGFTIFFLQNKSQFVTYFKIYKNIEMYALISFSKRARD